MRCIATVAVALLVASVTAAGPGVFSEIDASPAAFGRFAAHYGKTYVSEVDRAAAFANYKATVARAADAQARNPHARFGIPASGDAPQQRRAPIKFRDAAVAPVPPKAGGAASPASVDWRGQGVLLPVMNQGQCGGCCTTMTLALVGTALDKIQSVTPTLTELSNQQLMNCASNCGADGCNPDVAIDGLIKNAGGKWDSAESYTSMDKCADASGVEVTRVTKYVALAKHSETAMEQAVVTAPIGVAVNADSWQTYTGGVLTDCGSSTYVDHTATLIGYDNSANPPYWIVQNQWGSDWGEEGFIRIAKGSNTCQIQDWPYTVEVTKP